MAGVVAVAAAVVVASSAASSVGVALTPIAASQPIYLQMAGKGADWKDLIPLATGILGAAVAFLANWFSNRHARALAAMNLQWQFKQKSDDLTLDRFEQLHVLFDKWQHHIQLTYIDHLRVYANKLSFEQAQQLIRERGALSEGELQRIRMLVAIYAPMLESDYEQVHAARKRNVPFLKDPSQSRLSKADFITAQNEFDAAARKFLELIASEARNLRKHP